MLRSDKLKKKANIILGILCLLSIVPAIVFINIPKSEEANISQREPEPLIISNPDWEPHGIFNGTIVIDGEGIADSGYEGVMYIEMDGDKIRISCTEAVRSRYGELF